MTKFQKQILVGVIQGIEMLSSKLTTILSDVNGEVAKYNELNEKECDDPHKDADALDSLESAILSLEKARDLIQSIKLI